MNIIIFNDDIYQNQNAHIRYLGDSCGIYSS